MKTRRNRLLILSLRLAIGVCFGSSQADAEDSSAGPAAKLTAPAPADRKETTPFSTAYDFLVGTSNRSVIHKKLYKLYLDTKSDVRQEWSLIFPDETRSDGSNASITKGVRNEVGTAAAKEFIDSVPALRALTKNMRFSLDFSTFFSSKNMAAKSPPRVTYGVVNKNPSNDAGTGGEEEPIIGPIVAKEGDQELSDANSAAESGSDLASLGKFNGSVVPRLGDQEMSSGESNGKSYMDFIFQQQDGYYVYRLPVGKGPLTDTATHEFMAPVWGELQVSREYSSKGATVRSGLKNLLVDEHRPKLDVFYLHQEHQCAAQLQISHDQNAFQMKGQVPLEGFSVEEKTFNGEGAEYTMGYSRPL